MSWGLGWKRSSDTFHLTLSYGSDVDTLDMSTPRSSCSSSSSSPSPPFLTEEDGTLGFRIDLDWLAAEDVDQAAIKLKSQLMVALPAPHHVVQVNLIDRGGIRGSVEGGIEDSGNVGGGSENRGSVEGLIDNIIGRVSVEGHIANSGNVGGGSGIGRSVEGGSGDSDVVGGRSLWEQALMKLQSQVAVTLPAPWDADEVELKERGGSVENVGGVDEKGGGRREGVEVELRVVKRREPLRGVVLWREGTSGQQNDGLGVLFRLMRSNFSNGENAVGILEGASKGCAEHWQSLTLVSLCCIGLAVSNSRRLHSSLPIVFVCEFIVML